MNIVLVEDSVAMQRVFLHYLERIPNASINGIAATEDTGIELIRRMLPDVVLLDLSLAQGSGLNLLARCQSEGHRCQVMVLTNLAMDSYRSRCLELGAAGFYDKASEVDLLMARLTAWDAGPVAVHHTS
jgi:DNA-binding NarL/FixJ family response regulator